MVDKKAAVLIEEKNLKGDLLVRTIDELLINEEKRNDMKKVLNDIAVNDSATRIYHVLKELSEENE